MSDIHINKIVRNLAENWKGEIGIHTHNNLGLALSNTVTAIKRGVKWVDSTVMGMGRGAGNAQTEYLILELEKFQNKFYNNLNLLKLIKFYFEPLLQKYNGGSTLIII